MRDKFKDRTAFQILLDQGFKKSVAKVRTIFEKHDIDIDELRPEHWKDPAFRLTAAQYVATVTTILIAIIFVKKKSRFTIGPKTQGVFSQYPVKRDWAYW